MVLTPLSVTPVVDDSVVFVVDPVDDGSVVVYILDDDVSSSCFGYFSCIF